MLIQTFLNIIIFAFFMNFSFQAMKVVSQPISIDPLKYDYLQLQFDTLSTYYRGAHIQDNGVCFNSTICIVHHQQRLILTPGYQILLENLQDFNLTQNEDLIIINLKINEQWQKLYVKNE
jgi:hypothetical protein